jgi:hypothetical protein
METDLCSVPVEAITLNNLESRLQGTLNVDTWKTSGDFTDQLYSSYHGESNNKYLGPRLPPNNTCVWILFTSLSQCPQWFGALAVVLAHTLRSKEEMEKTQPQRPYLFLIFHKVRLNALRLSCQTSKTLKMHAK